MRLLKRSTNPPLTHQTLEPWGAALNRQLNGKCPDLLLFGREQDTRIQLPVIGRYSAASLRPLKPIFVSVLGVLLLTMGVDLASASPSDVRLIALALPKASWWLKFGRHRSIVRPATFLLRRVITESILPTLLL